MSMRLQEADEVSEVQRLDRPIGAPILKRVPGMRSAKEERFAVCILKVVGIGGLSEWSVDGRCLCCAAYRKDNECGQKDDVQIIF